MQTYEFTTYEEALKDFIERTGGWVDNPDDYIYTDGEVFWYTMDA